MTSRRPGPRAGRAGFTLVEVIVAITILAGALLAIGGFVARFSHGVGISQARATATQLATERLETARAARTYASLDTLARTENPPAGYTGFTRVTAVTRIGGTSADTMDYRIVTVTVTGGGIPRPVAKTTIVGVY